jgi:hypothetical protein
MGAVNFTLRLAPFHVACAAAGIDATNVTNPARTSIVPNFFMYSSM